MRQLRGLARAAALLLFPVLIAATPACGAARRDPAFPRAFAEAERAQTAGRYLEAAASFDRAAAAAPDARQRDHARYLAAKVMARGGDVSGAAKRFRALAEASKPGEHTARALYDLADLQIDHGNDAEGYATLERVVLRHPREGIAARALQRALAERDRREPIRREVALGWLREITPRLAGTELEESAMYQTALRLHARGDLERAHAAFLEIVARFPYPRGRTWDDSLFHASEIDEGLGRHQEAIDHLRTMLDEREVASLMGSYQRPRFTPALMRIAALYRDRLHDHVRAREAYHRVYSEFRTSTQRDDALWEESKLFKRDGDAVAACDRLRTLADDFPDSRYVPCAVAECPSVRRSEKSGAPTTCRTYLTQPRDASSRD